MGVTPPRHTGRTPLNKTLFAALAVAALPLAGCSDREAAEAVTPTTDAPAAEEPAVVAEPLEADPLLAPEGEPMTEPMTEEPLLEEGTVAPAEETPEADGTTM